MTTAFKQPDTHSWQRLASERNRACAFLAVCALGRAHSWKRMIFLNVVAVARCPPNRFADLGRKTLRTRLREGSHRTIRSVADKRRRFRGGVHRVWQEFGLESYRQRHFELFTDPFFMGKVRDIFGLYLNPPDKTVELCVDERRPDPSPRSHPVQPPDGLRLRRSCHLWLSPARHRHPVGGSGRRHRAGANSLQTSALPSLPSVATVRTRQRRAMVTQTRLRVFGGTNADKRTLVPGQDHPSNSCESDIGVWRCGTFG
jgi:hypothetical protein